jgi:hypothetical protein
VAGPYASSKIGNQSAKLGQVLWPSGVLGIEQRSHQRGPDDHQIRETRHLASLRAIGYANSDTNHCGWIDLAYPLNEFRSGS